MPPERYQPQPPKETRMFRNVPMQAIADVLHTLPIPITITQMLDEQKETVFYRYQVGVTTPDNPVGIRIGVTRHFLDAVKISLQAVLEHKGSQGMTGTQAQGADPRLERRAPSPTDEWIVPEVEAGEASASQAAALGLPYRHRVTGETISQWTERTLHDHPDATSQTESMEEQELITLLSNLPISMNIWKRDDGYVWQCFEQSGLASDFPTGVREGLHSLVGQLMREQQGRRGTFRVFGDVLYQTDGGYTERVIADTSRARVVMCEDQGIIKLYRVEWTELDDYQQHKAVYTLHDAMDAFQAVVHPEREG